MIPWQPGKIIYYYPVSGYLVDKPVTYEEIMCVTIVDDIICKMMENTK